MWFLFQGLIIFAVVGSNIHWQWTPNPYIPAGAGILLAYFVTLVGHKIVGAISPVLTQNWPLVRFVATRCTGSALG
jgi:hypothetical protein